MSHSYEASIATIAIRHLFLGFLALWSACGSASGWNDFARDIGHGFRLSKTDSFHVCIFQVDSSAYVCGDQLKGNYGPVSGYFFTNQHLLVRTHGAKPEENSKYFETDINREHFFIMERKLPRRGRNPTIGPLDRDDFYKNPVVPSNIQWELPTRFGGDIEGNTSLFSKIVITIIAWLVVLGPIFIWPIILLWIAWRIFKAVRN